MRKNICLCALLVSLAGTFSCKKKEFGKLEVRFHHFAPNTGLLSWVYAGKDTVARISYTESSPYIVAGLENLSFNAFSDKQLRLSVSNPAWQQDSKYSVFVCDTPGTINKILIKDEQIPASTGKAYLRFIHLMPDTHAVQLMANDSVLFKSERFVYALRNYFKGISGYDTLSSGTYSFSIKVFEDTSAVVYPLILSFDVEEGKTYDIVAAGFPRASGTLKLVGKIIPAH